MSNQPTAKDPGIKTVFGNELSGALGELRRSGFSIGALYRGKSNAEWIIHYFKPGIVEEPEKDLFGAPVEW